MTSSAGANRRFILLFSQVHTDFRLAELRGIARALSLEGDVDKQIDAQRHVFVVSAPSEEVIKQFLARSMLLKSAYEYLEDAESHVELQRRVKERAESYERFNTPTQSFAVRVRPIGRKRGVETLEKAKAMAGALDLEKAPIQLDTPLNTFTVIEQYEHEKSEHPRKVYFGRLLGDGQYGLKTRYSLPSRLYIGNTTMDPELAFIQANICAVRPGDLAIDPFCGTGGLLISAAHFGAYVIGLEINYQIARGIGKSSRAGVDVRGDEESVRGNFAQYGMAERFVALLNADASRHEMWRQGQLADAIVADPPYGLREKSRKIGKKERKEHWTEPSRTDHAVHFPEKARYALGSVFVDLLQLAATRLRIDGRVAFWFPVIREQYGSDVLPQHDALNLVENCEQPLTLKTSRRLLTYEKTREAAPHEQAWVARDQYEAATFRDVLLPNNV